MSNEIHYQSIESVRGDTVIVADHSPGGDTRHRCDVANGDCEKIGKSDTFKPAIHGSTEYITSGQGRYGVYAQSFPIGGQTMTLFTLYDVSARKAKSVGLFSTTGIVVKKMFSPDEKTFVVVTQSGTVTSYDIPSKKIRTIMITQTELPFFNVSYGGAYISAYNYVDGAHRIWNTKTGALSEIKGAPSYVEFSSSENEAALGVDNNGFKNLSVATGFTSGSVQTAPVAHGDFLVEDHLYVGDTLYYLSNKKSPLSWNIYVRREKPWDGFARPCELSCERSDTKEPQGVQHRYGEDTPIVTSASYGDYLKRVGGTLAYIKTEGKNANVYLYDKHADMHIRLDAAPDSDAASDITRNEITIADRTAALLSPKKTKSANTKGQARDLVVWLHGGPQRQTSIGYHPYLSYAVYDELLEKLASGGNYVLKLDYAGSWGYGQDFINTLDGHVGVVEIADVQNAIVAFKKKNTVDNVYLIGNSYGGYMAFKTINESPDAIDGIVSINGVADCHTLITAIPSSPFHELFDGLPDTHNLPLYQKASVFANADKIDDDTPLLVFYGTKDKTVPVIQSLLYDAFMRTRDKNVTLVALEEEEHVLHKRSTLTKLCKTVVRELSLDNIACNK